MFLQIEIFKKSDKKLLLDLNILNSESENQGTKSLENSYSQTFRKQEEETEGKYIFNNTAKLFQIFLS